MEIVLHLNRYSYFHFSLYIYVLHCAIVKDIQLVEVS